MKEKTKSMFEEDPLEPHEAHESHDPKTEFVGKEMEPEHDSTKENEHESYQEKEEDVEHPVLKTIMAKLKEKHDDEPASKGHYAGMKSKY